MFSTILRACLFASSMSVAGSLRFLCSICPLHVIFDTSPVLVVIIPNSTEKVSSSAEVPEKGFSGFRIQSRYSLSVSLVICASFREGASRWHFHCGPGQFPPSAISWISPLMSILFPGVCFTLYTLLQFSTLSLILLLHQVGSFLTLSSFVLISLRSQHLGHSIHSKQFVALIPKFVSKNWAILLWVYFVSLMGTMSVFLLWVLSSWSALHTILCS